MIGKTIEKYKIMSEIGKGGMGIVYLAEHVHLGRRFAVKCLAPQLTGDRRFSERFHQEARKQAQLGHPNIVQATDFFEQDGQFFLVMEYVDGQGLDEMIENRRKLPEKEALSIFKDVLDGLNFAHSRGVIHRDIKPSNILVDRGGRAKIMDFGIAIMAGEKRLTATGTNVGSPWYMSPEQIRHPMEIDHRSDVYSIGIVLYEILTGDIPFDGDTDYEIKDKQINSPVPEPTERNPQISNILSKIILKALEKVPDDRFNGCGELLEYIEEYETKPKQEKTATQQPASRPSEGAKTKTEKREPEPKGKPSKKYGWVWTVVLILLIAASGFLLMREKTPEPFTREKPEPPVVRQEPAKQEPYERPVVNGYITKHETVRIRSGMTADLNYELEKALASLKIDSKPSRSEIYIDGIKKGRTPVTITGFEEGKKYHVTLKSDGYETWEETVRIKPGDGGRQLTLRTAVLTRASASLKINSEPEGAEVYIDGVNRGRTPSTITGFEEGKGYNIKLKSDGYETWEKRIGIKSGQGGNN